MAATKTSKLNKLARIEKQAREFYRYGFCSKRERDQVLARCRRARAAVKGGAR